MGSSGKRSSDIHDFSALDDELDVGLIFMEDTSQKVILPHGYVYAIWPFQLNGGVYV